MIDVENEPGVALILKNKVKKIAHVSCLFLTGFKRLGTYKPFNCVQIVTDLQKATFSSE
jgi:hypothetical protein